MEPLYGKVRFDNEPLDLDGHLFTGLGTVAVCWPEPAFELESGRRIVARDWLAFNLAFWNATYVSTPPGKHAVVQI